MSSFNRSSDQLLLGRQRVPDLLHMMQCGDRRDLMTRRQSYCTPGELLSFDGREDVARDSASHAKREHAWNGFASPDVRGVQICILMTFVLKQIHDTRELLCRLTPRSTHCRRIRSSGKLGDAAPLCDVALCLLPCLGDIFKNGKTDCAPLPAGSCTRWCTCHGLEHIHHLLLTPHRPP
jgi:hypothetical protein